MKFRVVQVKEGDIAMIDADSFPLENRIYVMLDEQGTLTVNNHAITWSNFPEVIQYVMTNPDRQEGLPAKIEDAIICTNVAVWQPAGFSQEELQFRKQYLMHWISRVYFDKIQTLIADDWGDNWERIDAQALDPITDLLSPRLTIPDAPAIEQDLGIDVKLPPWMEEEPDVTQLKARNVLSVLVNAQGDILVRAQPTALEDLRGITKEFIANPAADENLAESPKKAIISLKNDRGTNYKQYLAVYNELKEAYQELWEEAAQERYQKSYAEVGRNEQRSIRQDIPFVISEAETTAFGEE